MADALGPQQGTILAGGRYDGLATKFGARNQVPATGWAAGIERINLLLEAMQNKNMMSVVDQPGPRERANISILAHVDKREQEHAPAIR